MFFSLPAPRRQFDSGRKTPPARTASLSNFYTKQRIFGTYFRALPQIHQEQMCASSAIGTLVPFGP